MEKSGTIYKVAIVGRPNVGKSSLFNRIAGRRIAITQQAAGTTRDRMSAVVSREGVTFELIDSGGFDMASKDHLTKLVRKQIEIAIKEADTILFICDVTAGITPQDEEILAILRKSGKGIMLVVNKADNDELKKGASEFFRFGMDEIYPASCLHNMGIASLVDGIAEKITPGAGAETVDGRRAIKIAVVGRPNVGKSSFVNRIINEERVIVHEIPGTTRDSIDIMLSREGDDYLIIDTAGMRHKRKIKEAVDVYSLLRARDSVERSDICVVIIDGYEGLTRDDMKILSLVKDCGKGSILLVNKWDLVSGVEMSAYENALLRKMAYIKGIPVLFISCKTGLNLEGVFGVVKFVRRNMQAMFSEDELREISDTIQKGIKIPLARSGRLIKAYGVSQESASPPVFRLVVNNPAHVTDDYVEAIRNILRRELGLKGAPIKIMVRRRAKNKRTGG